VEAGIAITANHVGSMFTFFFTDRAVTDWDTAATSNTERFGRFHRAMLNAGIWLPPSQFEAAFISAAHTEQEIDQTVAAAREALAQTLG
jgi:glutamate-1-semialdehyde 2,1-aminomutase